MRRPPLEKAKAKGGKVGLLVTETPANPTNSLVDLQLWREASEWIATQQGGVRPPVAVDNTFLGPVFQKPLEHGADLVMYSLTKYVGGHSDLVAGGVIGSKAMVAPVRALRSSLGTQLDPNTSWMIMRSMETLALRMRASADNAGRVAGYLAQHPKVASVNYLGHLKSGDPRAEVFERQCKSAGSTFAFSIRGGEAEAFRMLDALQVMKLAVSLGGTETLISHPASTTHSGVPKETRDRMGVTDALIRISVGIENADDLDRRSGAGTGEDLIDSNTRFTQPPYQQQVCRTGWRGGERAAPMQGRARFSPGPSIMGVEGRHCHAKTFRCRFGSSKSVNAQRDGCVISRLRSRPLARRRRSRSLATAERTAVRRASETKCSPAWEELTLILAPTQRASGRGSDDVAAEVKRTRQG